MCGIFGILSSKKENIYQRIIEGLIQLQNRGYDSSGLAVVKNRQFEIHKYASTPGLSSIEKLRSLTLPFEAEEEEEEAIYQGIGHNRWATHGVKNDTNAHPHLSNDGRFVLVHNGIIENYQALKTHLLNQGFHFSSQTDTEVIVNLISFYYQETENTLLAVEKTIALLQGTYGIILMSLEDPDVLFCVRNGSPLLVGQNEDCVIITSEQSGFCNLMNHYITLNKDDLCIIQKHKGSLTIKTNHHYSHKKVSISHCDLTPYPYPHWTIKEIQEQPQVILNAINHGGRIQSPSEVKLGGLEQHKETLMKINNIILLGCGTSFYACMYGMHFFKKLTHFYNIQIMDGAELTEYDIPKIGNTAFILVSQSGETKDLHRCIEIAKKQNLFTLGIINVVDSLIAREVDCGIYCNAGTEVGVASTKAFISQVVCLSLCAIWFSQNQQVNEPKRIQMIHDLQNLSNDCKNTLENVESSILTLSSQLQGEHLFLLGKGSDECIAKEGSLKIKEIAYIHAEGYSASSLKHGPFALLDEEFPVILLDLDQVHHSKIMNVLEEIHSRKSPIVLITQDQPSPDFPTMEEKATLIRVSPNSSYGSLLGVIPLQLLAYYWSTNQGINPDQPKNLAKVVTVE